MAYNGVVLARAREHLAELRENNAAEAARRTERVYELIPRVRAIDSALRRQMAELCTLAFSREDGVAEKIAALKEANLRLQAEPGRAARPGGPAGKLHRRDICLPQVPRYGIHARGHVRVPPARVQRSTHPRAERAAQG